MQKRHHSLIFLFFLVTVLAAIGFAYLPGLGGLPSFDDAPNLEKLNKVSDLSTAKEFVFSGVGTIGRPLALASFLPYAGGWQGMYADILLHNIWLHLLNTCLVIWCALRLFQAVWPAETEIANSTRALLVGGLWGGGAILVSASLSAIQRMTTLSATFVFLGFLLYISGRSQLQVRQLRAYGLMTGGVVFGTLFSVLTKENGILLPTLILATEFSLFRGNEKSVERKFEIWQYVFLWGPTLIVVFYLASLLPNATNAFAHRDFGLGQRLLSEPSVLLSYLKESLIPYRMGLTPFHDDYTPAMGWFEPFSVALSIGFWGAICIIAIYVKKIFPWLLFGVLWFLVGHSLEASVIPLELYFEHRNYVPLFGIWVAIIAISGKVEKKYLPATFFIGGVYLILCLGVTYAHTSVWGTPQLAARMWAATSPHSERAIQFLSQSYLSEGDLSNAWNVIVDASKKNQENIALAIQSIHVGCPIEAPDMRKVRFQEILQQATVGRFSFATHDGIKKLTDALASEECEGLTQADLLALIDRLRNNAKYTATPATTKLLLQREAYIYYVGQDLDNARGILQKIYEIEPNTQLAIDISVQFYLKNDLVQAKKYFSLEDERIKKGAPVTEEDVSKFESVRTLIEQR